MSDTPIINRSEATRAWLSDSENWAELWDWIESDKGGVRGFAYTHGLIYETLRNRIKADPALSEAYDSARAAVTEMLFEKLQDVEARLLAGELEAKAGAAIIKSINWRIEKLDPVRYGQRQQIDMRTTDMTKLHESAIRDLAKRPRTITPVRQAVEHQSPAALPASSYRDEGRESIPSMQKHGPDT